MKIIFFETNKDEQKELQILFGNIQVEYYEEKLDSDNVNLAENADIVSVFVNSEVSKEIIDKLPNLKLIQTRSTGYDHVDVEYAKSKSIKVATVPSYGARTVAEFTFALILSLSRKPINAYQQLRVGEGYDISSFQGFDLYDKTLGVIGTGKIGKNVTKIAKGFGMNVIACDLYPDQKFADEIGFKYVPLSELLANSDIITLHTFYTKENYHLINKDNIGEIKKGGYIINTARGELIETDALIKALTSKQLAGCALDVLESERHLKDEWEVLKDSHRRIDDFRLLLEDRMLIDLRQAIVTPHIAFYTKEAELEILKTTADTIVSFIENKQINILEK